MAGLNNYQFCYRGIMKITVDIPKKELADALRFSGAATKREAIVTAIREYNHRRRMAALITHAGTFTTLVSLENLRAQRRRG